MTCRRYGVSLVEVAIGVGWASLCATAAADGEVRPQEASIASVRIGMTPAQVPATRGRPERILRITSEVGPRVEYRYDRGRLRIRFEPKPRTVDTVISTNPRYRTANGLGVGSTVSRVRAYLRRPLCGYSRDFRWFCLGIRPGFRSTLLFAFRGNRAWAVAVDRPRVVHDLADARHRPPSSARTRS